MTWCIIMLVAGRCTVSENTKTLLQHWDNHWLIEKGPKCPKKTFCTPLHRHALMLLTPGSASTICHGTNPHWSEQVMFFQSSAVHCWSACVQCSLTFVFLADRGGAWHGLPPEGSTCCAFCFSAHHGCKEQLSEFLSAHTTRAPLLWPLTSTRRYHLQSCHSLDVPPHSWNPSGYMLQSCAWKSKEISSFTNAQPWHSQSRSDYIFLQSYLMWTVTEVLDLY